DKVKYLILGIIIIIVGFRAYSYFDKNQKTIDNEPGKLFGIAVLIIIIGFFMALISIINFLRE
ncbi:hypothetical protein, partial [Winogradskyella sp.]